VGASVIAAAVAGALAVAFAVLATVRTRCGGTKVAALRHSAHEQQPLPAALDPITLPGANALQKKVLDLVPDIASFFPQLMFSYATGTRDCDAPGTGPGLVYAAQLALRFAKARIPCFTGLHVPPGDDWKIYYTKLDGRFSECSVFIVLLTPALYQSMNCLEEVSRALRAKRNGVKVKVIPLRMELQLPGKSKQWPGVKKTDVDNLQRLTEVQEGLGKINAFPARGTLFCDSGESATYVDQLLEMVAGHLAIPAPEEGSEPK
jgi:hypothetical protein